MFGRYARSQCSCLKNVCRCGFVAVKLIVLGFAGGMLSQISVAHGVLCACRSSVCDEWISVIGMKDSNVLTLTSILLRQAIHVQEGQSFKNGPSRTGLQGQMFKDRSCARHTPPASHMRTPHHHAHASPSLPCTCARLTVMRAPHHHAHASPPLPRSPTRTRSHTFF